MQEVEGVGGGPVVLATRADLNMLDINRVRGFERITIVEAEPENTSSYESDNGGPHKVDSVEADAGDVIDEENVEGSC